MTSKRASADPSKEAHGLYMVEKYERVIDYLYPLAQTIPRKHGTFRFCGFRIRRKFKLVKRQSMVRQRRRLKLLLQHEDHEGWRCSQIAWMGHLRHADGQNGLVSLGLATPC